MYGKEEPNEAKREYVFKKGAVVQLNSGGPPLNVTNDVEADDLAQVIWIDNKGQLQEAEIHEACLKGY